MATYCSEALIANLKQSHVRAAHGTVVAINGAKVAERKVRTVRAIDGRHRG